MTPLSRGASTAHDERAALLWTQLHLGSDALGLLDHLVALHGTSMAAWRSAQPV